MLERTRSHGVAVSSEIEYAWSRSSRDHALEVVGTSIVLRCPFWGIRAGSIVVVVSEAEAIAGLCHACGHWQVRWVVMLTVYF